MKRTNHIRRAVTFLAAYFLFCAICGTSHASQPADRHSAGDNARLIVRRVANLGNNVIVNLSVDGTTVAAIGFGHTYRGVLSPGRHVLSVQASPRPRSFAPANLVLNVRGGETYKFTATGDGAGNLILKGS